MQNEILLYNFNFFRLLALIDNTIIRIIIYNFTAVHFKNHSNFQLAIPSKQLEIFSFEGSRLFTSIAREKGKTKQSLTTVDIAYYDHG